MSFHGHGPNDRHDADVHVADTARCAGNCGAYLEFRTGRLGESLERCPAGCFAWRRIQPLFATRPSQQLEKERARVVPVRQPRTTPRAFDPALLAAVEREIPVGPERTTTRQSLLATLPVSPAWLGRALRSLRDAGRVRGELRDQHLHLWRAA